MKADQTRIGQQRCALFGWQSEERNPKSKIWLTDQVGQITEADERETPTNLCLLMRGDETRAQ